MAVYSMTGYANAAAGPGSASAGALHEQGADGPAKPDPTSPSSAAPASLSIELRSVNGRFLDIALRLPDEFRTMEPALRDLLTTRFRRGKIELRLTAGASPDAAIGEPGDDQLARLAQMEQRVRRRLPQARALSVNEALHWCRGSTVEAAGATDGAVVLDVARRCAERLAEARAREGGRLAALLRERVDQLRALAGAAEPLVPSAVARQQQRFIERWTEAMAITGAAQTIAREAIEERALHEAAAHAVRIDVAEELGRLRSHLDEVARLLERGGEVGKRLEFLIQELLREANTLGSKSSSFEMTALTVDMKVAIEQMREQVQNLE